MSMKLFPGQRTFVGGISLILLVLSSMFVRWESQNAQERRSFKTDDAKVKVRYVVSKEPVRAISFGAVGRTFAFTEEVATSPDWLKDFSVDIQNISDKTVTYVDIGVFVERPEGQESSPPFHFSINKGDKQATLQKKEAGLALKPSLRGGKPLRLSIDSADYESIKTSLDRLGYGSKIRQLEVQIEEVGFSDGTLWSLGRWYKADPVDPGKLIRIMDDKSSGSMVRQQ